jgi:hypothetical protein
VGWGPWPGEGQGKPLRTSPHRGWLPLFVLPKGADSDGGADQAGGAGGPNLRPVASAIAVATTAADGLLDGLPAGMSPVLWQSILDAKLPTECLPTKPCKACNPVVQHLHSNGLRKKLPNEQGISVGHDDALGPTVPNVCTYHHFACLSGGCLWRAIGMAVIYFSDCEQGHGELHGEVRHGVCGGASGPTRLLHQAACPPGWGQPTSRVEQLRKRCRGLAAHEGVVQLGLVTMRGGVTVQIELCHRMSACACVPVSGIICLCLDSLCVILVFVCDSYHLLCYRCAAIVGVVL